MPRARVSKSEDRPLPPATSLEARENQLILLATNLAEKQLREGTASSQVIAHYLKLGSTRERLEQERLRGENDLARAKKQKIDSDRQADAIYQEALTAFRSYAGFDSEDTEYDDYDD